MSLQAALDAFKANFEAGGPPYYAPSWVHDLIHRGTDELIASEAASRALKAGAFMPDFKLPDPYGASVSSASLLAEGPLLVCFHQGLWCPYCNLELQALEGCLPQIRRCGASLVSISPQTQKYSYRSMCENKLSFPLLSDYQNTVAAAFGLCVRAPDYLIEIYRSIFGADLTMINADSSGYLPIPARFVVCRDGRMIYSEVNQNCACRPDPGELLPALDTARQLKRVSPPTTP
jgi:peroxiredoxin